jgi:hypothetical protein
MKYFYFLLLTFLFSITGCKDEGTKPLEFSPGYQQDIPWLSLADSPWPMNHHDPQSTGRSKYAGPISGIINWEIDSVYMKSGISIGVDSTIYFVSIDKPGLYAVRPDGTIKWICKEVSSNQEVITTPLVAKDGTIYVGGGLNGILYAVNKDGILKWQLPTLGFLYHVGLNIGIDGTIYLLNGNTQTTAKLVAVNPSGSIDWYYENPMINYSTYSGTSISPDGKTIYVPGNGPSIFAIDLQTHQPKWSFGQSKFVNIPVIDSDGNIYLLSRSDTINEGKTSIFCLNSEGNIRWSFILNKDHKLLDGTIDKFGNYYFAYDSLYSIDFNGRLRWKLSLNGITGSIVNDKDGNIYFTLDKPPQVIYAVDNYGILKWTSYLGDQLTGQSPAIGSNKTIYIPSWKSTKIFSVK